MTNTVTV